LDPSPPLPNEEPGCPSPDPNSIAYAWINLFTIASSDL
jgi:hypothetical protein